MNYLIIGNSAAAIGAIEAIRQIDNKGKITAVSSENHPAYCRCLISYYLAGTRGRDDLSLRPKDFYKKFGVDIILGKKVLRIVPQDKQVQLEDGQKLRFDRLLVASGGSAKSLGIAQEEKKGVYKFRTIDDAKGLLQLANSSKKAVVLGGGLVGLKAASGLKAQGLEVEVIVKSNVLMSQVLDKTAGVILRDQLERNGIKIRTGLAAKEIFGKDKVEGLVLDNQEKLKCQIVVIGKGVASNIDLVKGSGIKTQSGILTDQYLATNLEGIFAAGDCAETYDLVLERSSVNALWSAASLQGRIAGYNMAGEKRVYNGSVAENSVEFYGLGLISLGIRNIPEENRNNYQELVKTYFKGDSYKKAIIKDNRLVGLIMVGTFNNAGVYLSLIRERVDITDIKNLLLDDNFGYAKVKQLMPRKTGQLSNSVSVEGIFV
ncbi:MAG: FAD-dependent oxidoreductase [Candidatus Omnitrophota bacterium]